MKRIFSIIFLAIISATVFAGGKHSYEVQKQDRVCKDSLRILCIGNSFTFYYDTYNIMEEIAWSEGHRLKIKPAYVGGYSFARHLVDPNILKAIEVRSIPYDYVFLQNQSQLNAYVGRNPSQFKLAIKDAKDLVERVREYSPKAHIFIESTWSFEKFDFGGFDSLETFDLYTWKGSVKMGKACKCGVSPISKAFTLCRSLHPEINLLYKDRHHQSMEGAYLKACVNYLLIYGGKFSSNVSCCGLDPKVATALQSVAEQIVNK